MAYEGINFTPPKGAVEEAKRALEWVREFGRGGTNVGRTTARMLASGNAMSPARVRRMARYFPRHEVDKQAEGYSPGEDGYPSNGRIAWALWGGDAGKTWSTKKVGQMNKWDDENKGAQGNIAPEQKALDLMAPAVIDDAGHVTGIAAAFGNLDRHGDIILPGAFDKALHALAGVDDVAFLWNHDTDQPLGPLTKLAVVPEGLAFDGQIVPTTWGKDVQLLLETGTIKKMSFGYRVAKAAYVDDAVGMASAMAHYGIQPEWSAVMTKEAAKAFDQNAGVRLLVDLDPWEVSLVPVPANPRAELSAAKGITLAEAKGAAPFRDYAIAPIDTEFDAAQAEARVKEWAGAEDQANAAYRSGFAWFDSSEPKQFDAYRLPITDVIDTKLVVVPLAVFAAAQLVHTGKARIPDSDAAKVRGTLDRYYAAMRKQFADPGIVAPWSEAVSDGKCLTGDAVGVQNSAAAATEAKAGRVLSAKNVKKLRSLRSAMADGMKALDELFTLAGVDDDKTNTQNTKAAEPQRASADELAGLFSFTTPRQ